MQFAYHLICIGQWAQGLLSMYHQPLSPLAYADQMVSKLIVVLLPHGSLASVLFGTLLVLPATFATSYISDATRKARAVATAAEARKEKYALLSRSHHFVPIAIETSGALGSDALSLLTDISRHQKSITHDHQTLSFLLQSVRWQCCLCIGHRK